jgi:hypothetical protein
MKRVRLLCFALLLAVVPVVIGAAPSGAARSANAAKFVGTYSVTVDFNGQHVFHKMAMTINADGTWSVGDGAGGTWSNTRRHITLVNECCSDVFPAKLVGIKTAKGINSWRRPGPWYYNEGDSDPTGTWYAVKRG